jgi:branched-chain amino acid transport system substrate-binding protein
MYGHAGSALHNAYFSEHWHRDNPNEKSRQFVKAFQQTFHQEADSGTALAYDAVFLFADALGRANTFAPQEIQRALAATRRFEGVTGRIGFDANRNPVKSAVISRIENKTITYVKTVEP